MNRIVIFSALFVLGTTLLSGCVNTNSEFSCPAPKTGMCQSVRSVDNMVDSGQIHADTSRTTQRVSISTNTSITWDNFSTPYAATIHPGQPLRQQEIVMAVWMSPYEDSKGYYHDESTVYAVMIPSQWSTQPVKAVEEVL